MKLLNVFKERARNLLSVLRAASHTHIRCALKTSYRDCTAHVVFESRRSFCCA
jgi:hypothetical protein